MYCRYLVDCNYILCVTFCRFGFSSSLKIVLREKEKEMKGEGIDSREETSDLSRGGVSYPSFIEFFKILAKNSKSLKRQHSMSYLHTYIDELIKQYIDTILREIDKIRTKKAQDKPPRNHVSRRSNCTR